MIEIPIPQDITKYDAKLIGPFSKRECIAIFISGVMAYGTYFLLNGYGITGDVRNFLTIVAIVPGAAYGWFKYNGMRLENIIFSFIVYNFLAPKKRIFKTESEFQEKYNLLQENALKKNAVKYKKIQQQRKLNEKPPKIKKHKNPKLTGYL